MSGWIKLHRQFLDWEWYDEPNTMRLFLHLILKANHKPKKYRGVLIQPGEVMTGLDLLSKELNLSMQQIRTSINRLKSTNEITNKTSPKGSIIQIVNYDKYQVATNEITNEQQTSNKQVTTNKNDKNIKNIKNSKEAKREESKTALKSLLAPYVEIYGKDMLNDFYYYWTEHGPNDYKLRYEKEKSFSVERRLSVWNKRQNTFTPRKPKIDRL